MLIMIKQKKSFLFFTLGVCLAACLYIHAHAKKGHFSPTPPTIHETSETASSTILFGKVFEDKNGNGVQDSAELGVPNIVVEINPGSIYTITTLEGTYNVQVGAGDFQVSINPPDRWTQVTPSSPNYHEVNGLNCDPVVPGGDFGLQPSPSFKDGRVVLASRTPAKPGEEMIYQITYSNIGTDTIDGSITFERDPLIVYNSSEPVGTQIGSNKHIWNFENLLPGEHKHILVNLELISTLSPGIDLNSSITSTIPGDIDLSDNQDEIIHEVVSIVNKNNKTVYPKGSISPGYIFDNNGKIVYTLNFQNQEGTVVPKVSIDDIFDSDLDVSTLEVLASNNTASVSISSANGQEVAFELFSIDLPPDTDDLLGSYGFLKFAIAPKSSVWIGTQISNQAEIKYKNRYEPTNTVNTFVDWTTDLEDQLPPESINIYPNPTTSILNISLQSGIIKHINISNQQGQLIQSYTPNTIEATLETSELPTGIYIAKIETSQGIICKKFSVR